jgi:hypothetical protein
MDAPKLESNDNTRQVSYQVAGLVSVTYLVPVSLNSCLPLPLPTHSCVILSQVSVTDSCIP